jgi:phosphoribosylaminoimidazole-succinocarboxamide synthase
MINPSALAAYARYTLPEAVIPELPGFQRGKVRDNYDLKNGTRILVASDRLSAFDRNLAVIPLKGQVRSTCAAIT